MTINAANNPKPSTPQTTTSLQPSFTPPDKYLTALKFNATKPHEISPEIITAAFNLIDTDFDEFIYECDLADIVEKYKVVGVTKDDVNAMFFDALSCTSFANPVSVLNSSKTILRKSKPSVTNDRLNLADIKSATSFRKCPHTITWLPRKHRDKWIIIIQHLTPPSRCNSRGRIYAVSNQPLFVPPILTGKERDDLNISPLGFVNSRPSSRGVTSISNSNSNTNSRPCSPLVDDLSLGYFSSLDSSVKRRSSTSSIESGGLLVRPRFVSISDSSSSTSPINVPPPSSRRRKSDGNITTVVYNEQKLTTELAEEVIHSTTPGLRRRVSLDNELPSAMFGFDGKSSHAMLKKIIRSNSTSSIRALSAIKIGTASPTTSSPQYKSVIGKSSMSLYQLNKQKEETLQSINDNRGYVNVKNSHERKLEVDLIDDKDYLKRHHLDTFNTHQEQITLQMDKTAKCKFVHGFFGKSNQAIFEVDEEKPYKHMFREWCIQPLFLTGKPYCWRV